MSKVRKFAAGALAGAMVLGTMSGFASASETEIPEIDWSKWATAADNGIELPELDGDTLKFTANIPDFNQSSEGTMVQTLWEQAMEHYLGVDIDVTINRTPWADYQANELVYLSADDIADVNSCGNQFPALKQYGEMGVLLDLSQYTDYMKYYWDFVDGTVGGRDYAINADGSMYGFVDGTVNENDVEGSQSFTSFAYRFDVLQANDLQPATTLDEFTQLCADLQALIDDGTVDADYVIMNSTNMYAFYRGFCGIFHTWDNLYWNGNEWAFGPIEDNFRDMLKYLNGLYEAGYIDPEFATADSDMANQKASTGVALICPTLWAGSPNGWNAAAAQLNSDIQWGMAYLPSNPDYGTAWKWGSRAAGKALNLGYGIYFSSDVKNPEYLVAMIDYQYSDEMVTLLDWGVEGVTYEYDEDGNIRFVDSIANADEPAVESANYGASGSQVCRSGIPFVPQSFSALVYTYPEDPWWSPEDGYYEGRYWEESNRLGGPESIAPRDRAPVAVLDSDQSAAQSQLNTACETYAKEEALKFITGEYDVEDDSAWDSYVAGLKSQSDEDFDEVMQMLNDNTTVGE